MFDLGGCFLIEILDNLYCICGKAQVVHYHEHFAMVCGVERRGEVHNESLDVVAKEFGILKGHNHMLQLVNGIFLSTEAGLGGTKQGVGLSV